MSLKVSHVRGMPFVKVPFQCQFTIPKCACKVFDGRFGVSVGVFLKESPPSVREKFEEIESAIRRIASKKQAIVENLLEEEDLGSKLGDLRLIKNGIVWGKSARPSMGSRQKRMMNIVVRINHIFFSAQRVSISCDVLDMFPASA